MSKQIERRRASASAEQIKLDNPDNIIELLMRRVLARIISGKQKNQGGVTQCKPNA